MTVTLHVPAVARELASAADADLFRPTRARLSELGVGDRALEAMARGVSDAPGRQDEVLRLRARVQGLDSGIGAGIVERYLLLRAALASVEGVAGLRIPEQAKQLLLDEFLWLTRPMDRELGWFVAPDYVFASLCKLVTLRRFPAGQMHWELGGLPRSKLWKVPLRAVPRLVRGIVELGGFSPTLAPHLAWRRKQIVLGETEHYRSLFLMTRAMELQPEIIGMVAEAWFYSPDLAPVNPHLAWAARLFQTWGGTVIVSGPAEESSGVYVGSRARRQLADEGSFKPTVGLVLWPRAAMQRWASQFSADCEEAAPVRVHH